MTEDDLRVALLTLVPDPATDAALLAAVQRRIARRRTASRVSLTAVVAAGAVAAAALTVLPSVSQRGTHRTGHSVEVTTASLRTLAMIAAARPDFQPPGPGQYWYSKTREVSPVCLRPVSKDAGFSYFANCYIRVEFLGQTQTWIAANGSGRMLMTTLRVAFPSASDRAHWIAVGRPRIDTAPRNEIFRPHELYVGPAGLGKLPTDPVKLAAVIHNREFEGGPPGPGEDWNQIGDLIRFPNASPALRAAAFEVAEQVPGVKALGVVHFRGVTGVEIVYETTLVKKLPAYGGELQDNVLIVDQATSALRAEVHRYYKSGKLVAEYWITYLAAGLVNSITSVPQS